MVDALKNFMSTMTDTIMQQVSEQVKKPQPPQGLSPTLTTCLPKAVSPPTGTSLSYIVIAMRGERPLAQTGAPDHKESTVTGLWGHAPHRDVVRAKEDQQVQPRHQRHMQCIPSVLVTEHPMLKKRPPMISAPKPHNARKYCEFHEQNGHTTTECRELRKDLHELTDKGQIDRFLKRGPRFLRKEREPAQPEP
ncbi:hypothetical protein Cgig2_025345 [Carnegiea gigantea]|uniref:Reverse transcriptase domain-containing protein n=1 Tax=Carnegiea gigantea TaxID=171969 RepID=A0A9Q1Q695_9CARY|nr:hypothetical protein Cgig2_025345 [Carnegiea gigantea]